jgi:hypothetical protein
MSLVDRITKALDERQLDPGRFERAACALLQVRYPWLSPIEGGTDLGRDADLYRPIPENSESRGRLLVTTGEPLANLRRSHPRWEAEGLRVDHLVIVCSRPVSGKTRKKIENVCKDASLPLPEIYGRDWLVAELVKSPHWRDFLVGVRGRVDALARRPFDVSSPESELLGREEELVALRDAIDSGSDVVLSGSPGVGKTRLLLELGTDLWFVEPTARDHLADDLLSRRPAVVALDDAHLHTDVLENLVRLRSQEGLRFVVLVVSWADGVAEVGARLRNAVPVVVDRLTLDHMDAIVRGAGVSSVRARGAILGQAEGRPGWALRLCETLVDGGGTDVVSGAALLDHVERHVRQASDSLGTMDLLACAAALGTCSHDDLVMIAELVRIPLADANDSLRRLATNGLIDEVWDGWRLQPTLRAPLVARWFFGAARTRPWSTLGEAFPGRDHQLLVSMLEAAQVDPSGPVACVAHEWAGALPDPVKWDEQDLRLVALYARVGEEEARFASRGAGMAAAAPRQLQSPPWGSSYDAIRMAAAAVLRDCVRRWFNADAVMGLLDQAVTDSRSRPQTPEHAMRVLSGMTSHIDPDSGALFAARPLLLQYVDTWLSRDQISAARWHIACEAIRFVFDPTVEGTWSDPGRAHSISIARGVESAARLSDLSSLWARAADLLASAPPMPDAADGIIELIRLLEGWVRVAGGIGHGTQQVSGEQRAAAADGARAIYDALRPVVARSPGLTLRTDRTLANGRRWGVASLDDLPRMELDVDLQLLVGRRELGEDIEAWMQQSAEASDRLARGIALKGPVEGTRYFSALLEQATLAGGGGDIPLVASRLARALEHRSEWLPLAREANLTVFVFSLIVEGVRAGESLPIPEVERCLDHPSIRQAVVRAVLESQFMGDIEKCVVGALVSGDAMILGSLFAKDAPDEVLRALLTHHIREIRATTAVSFSLGDERGPELPDEWRPDWEAALLEADQTTVKGHAQWRLGELIKRLAVKDPDLCSKWFTIRLAMADSWWSAADEDDLVAAMKNLPQSHRERLARTCCAEPPAVPLLRHLVGHDPELTARLLEEGVLEADYALAVLPDEHDGSTETLMPVLLRGGVPAEAIANRLSRPSGWSGRESDAIRADLEWLDNYRQATPEVRRVCDLAMASLEVRLVAAQKRERDEAVRGLRF